MRLACSARDIMGAPMPVLPPGRIPLIPFDWLIKLGELILELKKNGFQVPMYTNAFMLSEKYLNKETGLGQLNSIRVSIYGMNEKQYFETTKKPNAFKIVTQNIINLIKYENNFILI